MQKLLVLGIGNILLQDDGVGVWAAQKLATMPVPAQVTIMDIGTSTQEALYLLSQYEQTLVLDAVHGQGCVGAVYCLQHAELLNNDTHRLSIHDIDLLEAHAMSKMLYGKAAVLTVLGIEPYDYNTWNMGLSAQLQPFFDHYVAQAYTYAVRLSA